jgi:hypothetical protein
MHTKIILLFAVFFVVVAGNAICEIDGDKELL